MLCQQRAEVVEFLHGGSKEHVREPVTADWKGNAQ